MVAGMRGRERGILFDGMREVEVMGWFVKIFFLFFFFLSKRNAVYFWGVAVSGNCLSSRSFLYFKF